MRAFCPLCHNRSRVSWSISMTFTLLFYGALHLLGYFLIKTKMVAVKCAMKILMILHVLRTASRVYLMLKRGAIELDF